MNDRSAPLDGIIAAHLAEWEHPFVELAIFGTGDARAIARAIDGFCHRELGSRTTAAVFYRSSIAAVAGVALEDGRRVVIKAHQPHESSARLRDVGKLQQHLAITERLASPVIAGPATLGSGLATVEEYRAPGVTRDGHQASVRRALAFGLNRIRRVLDSFVDSVDLRAMESPANALWHTPHSRLFDFEATRAGAEYIEDLARAARGSMTNVGRRVINHTDWRAEHVRFDGDAIVIAYDWDSLGCLQEPAAVGKAAHMFCAGWSRDDVAQAPTLVEARAFVDEYEIARGQPFSRDERRSCGAWFAYSVAYAARCGHASGVDIRNQPGNHQHLVATHGVNLLSL